MRLALVPRTTEFYDLFAAAGRTAHEAARLTEIRFREVPDATVPHERVKQLETEGDAITREIFELLNTQYVTPFDREDIFALATAIDDVVDHIEEASDLLELYGVDHPTKQSIDQCRILVGAVERLADALSRLKGLKGVQEQLIELKRLEDDGDRIVRDAIASLFHDDRIDPLIVIRWKDIYDALEAALDACETAANVLGNVVVKNQ